MRIDSCRNCGILLSITRKCYVCMQPIQFQCFECFKYVDDPIHTVCMLKIAQIC